DVLRPVCFGTLQSVFYHILKASHLIRGRKLLSGFQKRNILISVLKQLKNQDGQETASNELSEDASRLLTAISFYKNVSDRQLALQKVSPEWQKDFWKILDTYEEIMARKKAFDFDDLLCDCKKALSNDQELRKYWQNRFRHILIDEFQDINPVQYETIRLLTKAPYNIFAVGDDDQSIYGFRGSRPECLRRFADEFQARKIFLNINYRSERVIVESSLAVINENHNRFMKELVPASYRTEIAGKGISEALRTAEEQKGLRILSFEDREEQYHYLTKHLKEWYLASGRDTGENRQCAVLFRTNAYMQGLAARLRREDIPYAMNEKTQSIYEHFIVRDIMAYLSLAQGEWSRESMLRIMNRPSRYISREAAASCASLEEMISYYERAELSANLRRKILENLHSLQRQLCNIRNLSPGLAVPYIRRAAGYEAFLKERAAGNPDKWDEWQRLMEWLKSDGGSYRSVREWKDAQEAYTRSLEEGNKLKDQRPVESICLMTVHGAKGLEFDKVIIPDCNEGIFPHGRMPDPEDVEEERRIFYVAMTRSKKSLELLYLTGSNTRSRQVSRFLTHLYGSSTSSSNSQLSRNSSKASATFSYSSSSSM
ncbi:MAG: ATP-dependent helicase, partial [Acetatifactor sp.]|nr:ATP-dependent helicase [Acetatifactor sp.]